MKTPLFRSAFIAMAASACMAVAPAPASRGCSDAVLRQYAEVVQTAALNRAGTSSIFDGISGTAGAPPPMLLMMASDAGLCDTRPRAVLCRGNKSTKVLTLAQVNAIDLTLRAEFHYVSDQVLHGRDDWWTNDRTCGDCEDYALILSERLSAGGQAGSGMGLMIWSPAYGVGHATLMVETADAGIVEIGVSDSETARPMDWTRGKRAAYMVANGARQWNIVVR